MTRVWHRALAEQPASPGWVVALTAGAAATLVLAPGAWRRTRHVVTIVHEGAHGVVALLCGRRLRGIRLHSDTSGLTVSRGRATGPGMVATTAAGYLGPSVLGLVAARMLAVGHPVGLLWVLLVLLGLLVIQIRNWFGLVTVLGSTGGLFAVSWWLPVQAQSAAALLVTCFLLMAAPRPVLEMQAARRSQPSSTSDADQLARLTGVPGTVWVGAFAAVTVGAAVLGGSWLMPGHQG